MLEFNGRELGTELDIDGYLSPSIGTAISKIYTTAVMLTKGPLITAVSNQIIELCKYDPELGDEFAAGDKSVEACIKYVTFRAAEQVATEMRSKTKDELDAMPKEDLGIGAATMAGGVVDDATVFDWVEKYCFEEKVLDPVGKKTAFSEKPPVKPKKKEDKPKAKEAKTASPVDDCPEQLAFGVA